MPSSVPRPAEVDSPRLHRLVLAVVGLGLISLTIAAVAAGGSSTPSAGRFALATAALLAGDIALIHIRIGHNNISWTFSEAGLVAGLLLLPSPWLVPVAATAVAGAHLLARRSPLKVGYNAMTAATGVLLARGVYGLVAGGADQTDRGQIETWLGLAAAALAMAVWNGISISAVVGASEGVSGVKVFRQGGLLRLLSYLGNTTVALTMVGLYELSPASLVLVPAAFTSLYAGYKGYLRMTEDRDMWRILQVTSRDLNRLQQSDIADVVLDRAASLFRAEFVELMLVDTEPSTRATVFRQSAGAAADRLEAPTDEVAAGFWPRAYSEREPFAIQVADAPAAQRNELESLGLISCLVAPLVSQGRCLGTLRVGFRGPVTLTARELQGMATLVDQVSSSVLNAMLFETVTEERAKLSQVLDNASDGILAVDATGRVTSWNPAMSAMTGLSARQIVGLPFSLGERARVVVEGTPAGEGPHADAEWLLALLDERDHVEATVCLGAPDAGGRWLHVSVSALHTANDALESAVLVVRDVTALREAEEAKQDFVATVSHELRTPITSLKGWLLTLMRPEYRPGPDELQEVYTTLMHQTGRLQRLVEDLLSISVMEHGEFSVAAVPVSLDDVITKTVADLAVRSPQRPVSCRLAGAAGTAIGDPGRVEQILTNLLSNADKYSPAGLPIDISVRRGSEGIEVTVADHGRGIPEEMREVVFDRFRRLGHHLTRDAAGAGLGLHIARRLVEAMGGRIWVGSTPGCGATFTFTLPAAPLVVHTELPGQSSAADLGRSPTRR